MKNSFSTTTDELKFKIIIVGDSSVGKSSIFAKFVQGEHFQQGDTNKVTMVDFKLKEVNIEE
jgi:GTPase SAR1 family protein